MCCTIAANVKDTTEDSLTCPSTEYEDDFCCQANPDEHDGLENAEFDARQLNDVGFDARQLMAAGFDARRRLDAGFGLRQRMDDGFEERTAEGCWISTRGS